MSTANFQKDIQQQVIPKVEMEMEINTGETQTLQSFEFKKPEDPKHKLNQQLLDQDQGISFRLISNDGQKENMKLLIDFKCILSRQLPNMPKQYIVKLLFDRKHEALLIIKNSTVIGGISFIQFLNQKFVELVFLAINSEQQEKGYGNRLMSKYKSCMQKRLVENVLTYADNGAIQFFKKQGFSQHIKLNEQIWKGYVKEYDQGTFMECRIQPNVDYIDFKYTIKEYKNNLIECMKSTCMNKQLFCGQKIKSIFLDIIKTCKDESQIKLNPLTIPGINHSGWVKEDMLILEQSEKVSFKEQMKEILIKIKKHKQSWPFLQPVNKNENPSYFEIIKDPIDLSKIESKLNLDSYTAKELFNSDLNKMFANAKLFNSSETSFYQAAVALENYAAPFLDSLRDKLEKPVPFYKNMELQFMKTRSKNKNKNS